MPHPPARLPLAALLALISLAACATAATVEEMTPSIEASGYRSTGHTVQLANVSGGSATDPLLTPEVGDSAFQAALKIAVGRSGLFTAVQDSGADYALLAKIVHQDSPIAGFDFNVTIDVAYQFLEPGAAKILWARTIRSHGKASIGEAFVYADRLRKAKARAAKANFTILLDSLATVLGVPRPPPAGDSAAKANPAGTPTPR